jgi:hypothetical protein
MPPGDIRESETGIVFALPVFAVIRVAIGLARSWHAFVTGDAVLVL